MKKILKNASRQVKKHIFSIFGLLLLIIVVIYITKFSINLNSIISYLNSYQVLFMIFLTIIGWVTIFWLGLRQQKINLQNEARMRIYAELYEYRKKVTQKANELSVLLLEMSLPFMLMESTDIINEPITATKEANKQWRDFLENLFNKQQEFTNAYLGFWIHVEMWLGMMPELEKAKDILFDECNRVGKRIYEYHNFLQMYSIKEYDWHKWNKAEIQKAAYGISDDFSDVASGYVDDFMGLIHNELVADILNYHKGTRNIRHIKNKVKFLILTKDGIIEHEHIPNKKNT